MGEGCPGTAMHVIHLARAHDPPSGGIRLLVDRLWPRGVSKAALPLDGWPKDLTPSTGLRRWFHADRTRRAEFEARYRAELDAAGPAVEAALEQARTGRLVLVTAVRDLEASHAAVLRDYLEERL